MAHKRLVWLAGLLLAFALTAGGCGGSGSSSGSGGGASGNQVFAMDDLNTGYDHVWVTVDTVSVSLASGGTTTLFDATAQGGKVIDLRSLHDGAGPKFMLLGGCNLPSGSITGVSVVLGSQATIFPSGAGTGTVATFSGASGSTFTMTLAFPSPAPATSSNKVVVDFDLANWVLTGTTLTATNNAWLAIASPNGINDGSRHVPSDYDGTVGSLSGSAPTQTFVLAAGKSTLNVSTTAATTIANSDGSANPTLTNGQTVDVYGTFDTSSNTLTATLITVRVGNGGGESPERTFGMVASFDASAGTLSLQPAGCDRFEPDTTAVTVAVTPSTVFFGNSGVTDTQAQFFAALVAGTTKVVAVGSLSGSTFNAVGLRIIGPPSTPTTVDTAIQGETSNPNAAAGTFDMTIGDWEGGRLELKASVHIVTTTATVFRADGAAGTQAAFFSSLTPATVVRVRGSLDPSTMTLTAVLVGTGQGDDFHF